jgi:membrane associated rhomboid family serine protease
MAHYESRMNLDNSPFPPATKWLLVANGLFYIAQHYLDRSGSLLLQYLALWPLNGPEGYPAFMPWQLVSYGFLHGSFSHILMNMFGVWMFGKTVEETIGTKKFLYFYFICVVGAGLFQLATGVILGQPHVTVGASGGLFGILLAFGVLFPNATIMLLIPPMPVKAKYLVIGYGALELFNGVTGTMSGIAHFAHLGGMVAGLGVILYWRSRGVRPFHRLWS